MKDPKNQNARNQGPVNQPQEPTNHPQPTAVTRTQNMNAEDRQDQNSFPELDQHFDLEPPEDLLPRIVAEIPDDLGSAAAPGSEAKPVDDIDGSTANPTEGPAGNVVWGRFSRSTQLLAVAATLLVLGAAGWIASRMEHTEPAAPVAVRQTSELSGSTNASSRGAASEATSEAERAAETSDSDTMADGGAFADDLQMPAPTEAIASEEQQAAGRPEPADADEPAELGQELRREMSARIEPLSRRTDTTTPPPSPPSAPARPNQPTVRPAPSQMQERVVPPAASPPPPTPTPEADPIPAQTPPPTARPASTDSERLQAMGYLEGTDPSGARAENSERTREARNEPTQQLAALAERSSDRLDERPTSNAVGGNRSETKAKKEAEATFGLAENEADRRILVEADLAPATRTRKDFTETRLDALSTFGLDVDTGSYTALRASILAGSLPTPDRVRVEEVLNFFDYGDPAPRRQDLALRTEVGRSPFGEASDYRLVRVAVRARDLSATQRLPATLVFVVDTSGSMRNDGRLETVKEALRVLLDNLRADDQVALITYSSVARLVIAPTADRRALAQAISTLQPSGSTNLQAGLEIGYRTADQAFREQAINRVVLLSDGIANVGETEALPILRSVADWAARGVELTTVGVGMQHNDPLLERLANRGDGNYAYVDTLAEAERLFSEQLTGTLQTVASDARIQVRFDPRVVHAYRLIGYENRDLPDSAFRDDRVDAGEIGAGHRVTALYEVQLAPGSGPRASGRDALTVDLRYRSRRSGEMLEEQASVSARELLSPRSASTSFRLASLVAAFAEELREPAPSARRLRQVSAQVRSLVGELEGQPDVVELAYLIDQSARIAARR